MLVICKTFLSKRYKSFSPLSVQFHYAAISEYEEVTGTPKKCYSWSRKLMQMGVFIFNPFPIQSLEKCICWAQEMLRIDSVQKKRASGYRGYKGYTRAQP